MYQVLTSTYLLKKDYEQEFLTLLRVTLKQIIDLGMIITLKILQYLSYLDIICMVGQRVSLPYERFEWLKNVDEFDMMSISEESPIGFFLEVDLKYPDKLH